MCLAAPFLAGNSLDNTIYITTESNLHELS